MANRASILIVDDHAVFRHGLKDVLAKHFPGAGFHEAATGQAAVEQVERAYWSIVVLDVTLPGRGGLDVLRELKQIRPALPVLMLSMHPEEQYAMCALRAGAAGYISKIKTPLEIVEAVRTILDGGKYISPALATRLGEKSKPGVGRLLHERLSEREYQVMRLIPSGISMKEIASQLSISIQTASTYRARVLKKMGLRSSAALIRYALENKLVD